MKHFASRFRSKPLLLLALCLSLATPWVHAQNNACRKLFGPFCKSSTAFSIYNGPPPIPVCPTSVPVVQIDSIAKCGPFVAGPVRVLRCGISTDGFSYTSGGFRHVFEVRPTANWLAVLNGACEAFSYEVELAP